MASKEPRFAWTGYERAHRRSVVRTQRVPVSDILGPRNVLVEGSPKHAYVLALAKARPIRRACTSADPAIEDKIIERYLDGVRRSTRRE